MKKMTSSKRERERERGVEEEKDFRMAYYPKSDTRHSSFIM